MCLIYAEKCTMKTSGFLIEHFLNILKKTKPALIKKYLSRGNVVAWEQEHAGFKSREPYQKQSKKFWDSTAVNYFVIIFTDILA